MIDDSSGGNGAVLLPVPAGPKTTTNDGEELRVLHGGRVEEENFRDQNIS